MILNAIRLKTVHRFKEFLRIKNLFEIIYKRDSLKSSQSRAA